MANTRKKKAEKLVDEVQEVSGISDELFDAVISDIRKDFGDEGFQTHFETAKSFFSSGNLGINYAISEKANGGFPEGLVTEIYGDHSTGKSLIAYHALVETQKRGGWAILIDTEYAFNQYWFDKIGGDNERLVYKNYDTIEDVFNYLDGIVDTIRIKHKSNVPVTIVWDSLAATSTKAEIEKGMDSSEMAMRARKSGQGFRKVLGKLKKNNITLLIINQIRSTMQMYGPDVDTVGGKAAKFAASVRMEVRKGKVIMGEDKHGNKTEIGINGKVKVTKNRLRSPFAVSEFVVYWDEGIDPISGYLDACLREGLIIKPSQGWYAYKNTPEDKFRQKDFAEVLEKHPELLGDISNLSLDKFKKYAGTEQYEGTDDSVMIEEDEESLEELVN